MLKINIKQKNVAFIGAGSMAEGMISGIIQSKKLPASQIYVTNHKNHRRLQELQKKYGIQGINKEELDYQNIDCFILAMKPKDAENALHSIKPHIQPHQLILSVLAGIPISFIEKALHDKQPVIRIMPNTSSTIGASATAMSEGSAVSADQSQTVKQLLQCMGEVYVIDENKMDIFTGIAGSGPAFFYYLMEHIEKAGAEAGLSGKLTREIGAQTLLGAAKMLLESPEDTAVLKDNITSPNGTTAAGLKALEESGGGEAIEQAIKHAAKRSKTISRELERFVTVK
ncbi:pyrroline-5-carboxylate reductase [Bacillus sonorensis]|uniref:pyrroline-5-carboxylate reductase n=1 Tax=Bacillus sonorensis TaxID=119858 RepID=UPI00227F5FEB|nr:pyrroline-5-carboxylate reductase [Bacillus sonorensis]MCY7859320.1 pyrroline-5-carboxylate reductase [Bacillus sonorensis]MCZ0070419.1 pyrroline-5-carboxylate reductase [Bacillus sonorensis]MCZ0097807.1 pyrroline-5-carboxylate reductase [Bacillus sonorensis]MEC1437633.1 pyrroline-5-carboxylate reductase [Bacillus sonorensis]MEC1516111.1 pyrroline-5-carboxylate reductase [Bacillus sonorensis]